MTKLAMDTMKGFLWASIGTGSQAIIQLGVLIFFARFLAPRDFGLVAAAQVVVALAAIFTQLGVGPAIVQRPNLERCHLRVAFTLSCILGIGFTVCIALSAGPISWFFRIPELVPVIQVMSGAFFLKSFAVVPESLLRRELHFRKLAGIEIISLGLGFGAVGLVMAWNGYGVWSLVIAYMTQYALKSVLLVFVQPHPKVPFFKRSTLAELLSFGGGFTLGRIGNYLASQGDNLVVGRVLGADALGIYGRAYQLMVAPVMLLGQILDSVLFPAMAKVQHQPKKLYIVYRRGVSLIASTTMPVSIILVILAPEIITVLLGTGWEEAVRPFQVLSVATLFRTSCKMSDSLSRATGAVYQRAWRQGVYAFSIMCLAYIGSKWGLAGVSTGVLLAITINYLLMAHLSLQLTDMSWKDFFTAQLSPIPLATVVAMQSWIIANIMRAHSVSALYTLLIIALVISISTLLLGMADKKLFVGQDGLWILYSLALLKKGKTLKFDNIKRHYSS